MANPKIFVKDKHGKNYCLTEVRILLNVSQAWVQKHRTDSITLEELEKESKKIKRRVFKKEKLTRVAIENIPMGSWEAQQPCPPPGTNTIKEVLRDALHESNFIQRDAYLADKRKQKKLKNSIRRKRK